MNEFPGLDSILNVGTDLPALDPYICDMHHRPLSEEILCNIYDSTIYRLEAAGFSKEYDIKLISRYSFSLSMPDIEYCTDEFCPDKTVFLLTFSANGMHFITPPYNEGAHSPMSWDEWAFRTYKGEQLPLLIRAPWAQAKFINVGLDNG